MVSLPLELSQRLHQRLEEALGVILVMPLVPLIMLVRQPKEMTRKISK
jgi:hypothetical protein